MRHHRSQRARSPLAAATSFGYCGGYSGYAEGLQHDPPRRLLMAAIAVVYPCLLAYMIYVHSKKGGLEAPQILMKYGHFFTGARRRPSAMALYRPEISAHNTWHTLQITSRTTGGSFSLGNKTFSRTFRSHSSRSASRRMLCDILRLHACTHTHMHARTHIHAHAHIHMHLQTCTRTHARTQIYPNSQTRTQTRTHPHAHAHARTHARTHTHVCAPTSEAS